MTRVERARTPGFLAAAVGSALVAGALIIILVARSTLLREAYVSELGAEGEPTANWFEAALLLVVAGGSAIAWAGRDIRSTVRLLDLWTPATSLWIGCAFFFVASQVNCTAGCPLPVGSTFTWQDFVHTLAAVLAFSAACIAMLQTSFASAHPAIARLSLAIGLVVALIAGAGGILSLARIGTDVGSVLELVATILAIGWLAVFGVALAGGIVSASAPPHRAPGLPGARAGRSRLRRARSSGTPAPG